MCVCLSSLSVCLTVNLACDIVLDMEPTQSSDNEDEFDDVHTQTTRRIDQNDNGEDGPQLSYEPHLGGIGSDLADVTCIIPVKTGFIASCYTEEDFVTGKYSDVTLLVGTNPTIRIAAHRIVLQQSPTLKNGFFSKQNPYGRGYLDLQVYHGSGTTEVIRWMYTGELYVEDGSLDLLDHIFVSANYLELDGFLNFWTIRKEAVKIGRANVVEYLDNYIRKYFVQLIDQIGWKMLVVQDLIEVFGIVEGHVTESQLHAGLYTWERHYPINRRNFAAELRSVI